MYVPCDVKHVKLTNCAADVNTGMEEELQASALKDGAACSSSGVMQDG